MSLINFNEKILNHSFGNNVGTVSVTLSDSLHSGQVIKGSGDSAYTPQVSASSNCNVTLTVVNGSSVPSTTSWVVDFTGSSAGNFSFTIFQGYASRGLSVSGYYTNVVPVGAADEMSLGGDETGQSVNLELGNSATAQISMGDSATRALAGVSSGAIDMEDFYGQTASSANPPFGLAISYTAGSDTYTDTAIPSNTSGNNNTQITGTALWRRVRLTASSSGTFYLHIRGQRDGAATWYYGDAQVVAYVTEAGGAGETINRLHTSGGIMSGWQTYTAGTGSTWDSSSASSVGTAGSVGRFVIRTTNTVTTSSRTGRLSTGSFSGAIGYGYFETSQNPGPVSNAYYHARSPSFTLSSGDHVDVYYGVDCQAWQSIKLSLIT